MQQSGLCLVWDRAFLGIMLHVGSCLTVDRIPCGSVDRVSTWDRVPCGFMSLVDLVSPAVRSRVGLAWDHALQWTMPHVDRTKSTTMPHVGIMSYRESRHTWEIAPQKGDHTSRDKQPGAARQQMGLLAAYHGMPRNDYNT